MSDPQRYRLLSDESGHDYFVRVQDVDEFFAWVDATENDEDYEGAGFDENRIDGRFTFTNPKCE